VVLVIAHNAAFDRPFLENGFLHSPTNIGHAAVSILPGSPRASVLRPLNSWPMFWGFSTTGTALRTIAGQLSMRWPNRFLAQGGSHYRPFWKRGDCLLGDCGQGMLGVGRTAVRTGGAG
jgi:hypothetical protein